MKSLVVYTSSSGNTRTIATAIADELRRRGTVELVEADLAPASLPEADVVFIGGPTEGHSMTKPLVRLFDRVAPGSLNGTPVAAFDTRLRWPRLLSGSAAADIVKRSEAVGARMCAPPESFFVTMKPELEPGEIERAVQWAAEVADTVEAPMATSHAAR